MNPELRIVIFFAIVIVILGVLVALMLAVVRSNQKGECTSTTLQYCDPQEFATFCNHTGADKASCDDGCDGLNNNAADLTEYPYCFSRYPYQSACSTDFYSDRCRSVESEYYCRASSSRCDHVCSVAHEQAQQVVVMDATRDPLIFRFCEHPACGLPDQTVCGGCQRAGWDSQACIEDRPSQATFCTELPDKCREGCQSCSHYECRVRDWCNSCYSDGFLSTGCNNSLQDAEQYCAFNECDCTADIDCQSVYCRTKTDNCTDVVLRQTLYTTTLPNNINAAFTYVSGEGTMFSQSWASLTDQHITQFRFIRGDDLTLTRTLLPDPTSQQQGTAIVLHLTLNTVVSIDQYLTITDMTGVVLDEIFVGVTTSAAYASGWVVFVRTPSNGAGEAVFVRVTETTLEQVAVTPFLFSTVAAPILAFSPAQPMAFIVLGSELIRCAPFLLPDTFFLNRAAKSAVLSDTGNQLLCGNGSDTDVYDISLTPILRTTLNGYSIVCPARWQGVYASQTSNDRKTVDMIHWSLDGTVEIVSSWSFEQEVDLVLCNQRDLLVGSGVHQTVILQWNSAIAK